MRDMRADGRRARARARYAGFRWIVYRWELRAQWSDRRMAPIFLIRTRGARCVSMPTTKESQAVRHTDPILRSAAVLIRELEACILRGAQARILPGRLGF